MKLFALIFGILASQITLTLADKILRQPTFWSPKNIYISVLVPGSSHTTWVLEIGQELAARGHNVSFLCKKDGAKYAKDYPDIKVLSMGEPSWFHSDAEMMEMSKHEGSRVESIKMLFDTLNIGFHADYLRFSEYLAEFRPDLMICDVLTDSCMRSADEHDIPFVVTSTSASFAGKSQASVLI
jgi:UDP:flavonoid glycosyltransferase YjiC (YdhE family)